MVKIISLTALAIALLFSVAFQSGYSSGRADGLSEAQKNLKPYWQVCPEPSPTKYLASNLIKGDEHGLKKFISTHEYRKLTLNLKRENATCQNALYRSRSFSSATQSAE